MQLVLGILRIQIINNKLYVEHHVASIYPGSSKLACNNIIKRLDRILNTRKIKNVDFIFMTIDNIPNISKKTAEILDLLGTVYRSLGNLELAKRYVSESNTLLRNSKFFDKFYYADNLLKIASINLELGEYYKESEDILNEKGFVIG